MGTGIDTDASGLDSDLSRRIVRGSAWVGLGYGLGQAVLFASMLVLVRLLDPKAFGIVAAGIVLLAVLTQIQESGVGAAVVQGRHRDPQTAAASAFVFATTAGLALTGVVILVAPLYTHLIRLPEATPYIQVLAAVLAFRGLAVVPGALLERELDFRSRTKAELCAFVTQAGVAVGCAVGGLGAWSLVAGQLAGSATQTGMLWIQTPFWPAPGMASRAMLRDMLRYGRFVSGANVLIFVNEGMDKVIVGRFLGAASLGSYSLAWRLAGLSTTFVGVIVGRVMFSVYARVQHDVAAVRVAYVQNLQRTLLLALPVAVALAVAAEPIVLGLLGPKWTGVIDPLRLLAVLAVTRLIVAPSGELFKGIGRPHLSFLGAALYFTVALPALLLLVPPYETSGAAFALVLAEAVVATVMLSLTFNAIALRPVELARASSRPVACAAVVALVLGMVVPLTSDMRPLASLALVAAAGAGAYLVSVAVFARSVLSPIAAGLRRA
jgi:O-antigen/teichoic acid export membrane protein